MKKLSLENKESIFSALYGLATAGVLVFALLTINETILVVESPNARVFLFFVFFFLVIARGLLAVHYFSPKHKNRIAIYKNLAFALVYLVISVFIIALYNESQIFAIFITLAYLSTIIANRICLIFEKRKLFSTIYNIILAILAGLLTIVVAVAGSDSVTAFATLVLMLIIIMVISLIEVLSYAFAKIQLKGLLKIMRKTYVFEILYGLVILIISFSFYFMIMENSVETFEDGLWYSFAIVTTIGLGDITVTSSISRLLSVILGIYGIIVVASITSVIVNYYNEVKDNKTSEKETKKELEENKEDKE